MNSKSNDHGRAYEFACLRNLSTEISKTRSCKVIKNSSYFAAEKAWNTLSTSDQAIYHISSLTAVAQLFQLEPRISEQTDDELELLIQADSKGKEGDVRDILLIRQAITWEIGLSLKHNHFAVKHSRLSSHLDFGKSWYGISCSKEYWDAVAPIFRYLQQEEENGLKFSDLPHKETEVYIPLLNAFIDELKRQTEVHKDIPAKMVEYLLGKFDFYKVISIDREELTRIHGFNIHGTLNLPSLSKKAAIKVPVATLPKRIVHIGFVPNKNNTVEIYMDGGWQFSFRIHNATTYVEPSLKFDIQIVGMPTAILTINCLWR